MVRETSDEAWRDARARVAAMADGAGVPRIGAVHRAGRGGAQFAKAVGQQRLLDLADRADVRDSCLYTAPGRVGGGGAATTWLVGAYDEVAAALRQYADLGITHFILSDAPYLRECARIGDELLPRLRASLTSGAASAASPSAFLASAASGSAASAPSRSASAPSTPAPSTPSFAPAAATRR